jgi:hypothetical protein
MHTGKQVLTTSTPQVVKTVLWSPKGELYVLAGTQIHTHTHTHTHIHTQIEAHTDNNV